MKYLNKFLSLGILAAALTACSTTVSPDTPPTDKTGKEYTSMYICPMHCAGSGSDSMGVCPVCKMDYVQNEEHSHEGHAH